MNTLFNIRGNSIFLTDDVSTKLTPVLPAEVYSIKYNQAVGYWLEIDFAFKLPDMIYGNLEKRCSKILRAFNERTDNTGVLLLGDKGSGKSLLAKKVVTELLKIGIPTILINKELLDDEFIRFINRIKTPICWFIDEFDKKYDREDQVSMLSILDGTSSSKKLVMMTSNDKWGLNRFLLNRPGRILYKMKFSSLSEATIKEYLGKNLRHPNPEKVLEDILKLRELTESFNFDVLAGLVEELNRYPDEDIKSLLDELNIQIENDIKDYIVLSCFVEGKSIYENIANKRIKVNPYLGEIYFKYTIQEMIEGEGLVDNNKYVEFTNAKVTKNKDGSLTLQKNEDVCVIQEDENNISRFLT